MVRCASAISTTTNASYWNEANVTFLVFRVVINSKTPTRSRQRRALHRADPNGGGQTNFTALDWSASGL